MSGRTPRATSWTRPHVGYLPPFSTWSGTASPPPAVWTGWSAGLSSGCPKRRLVPVVPGGAVHLRLRPSQHGRHKRHHCHNCPSRYRPARRGRCPPRRGLSGRRALALHGRPRAPGRASPFGRGRWATRNTARSGRRCRVWVTHRREALGRVSSGVFECPTGNLSAGRERRTTTPDQSRRRTSPRSNPRRADRPAGRRHSSVPATAPPRPARQPKP